MKVFRKFQKSINIMTICNKRPIWQLRVWEREAKKLELSGFYTLNAINILAVVIIRNTTQIIDNRSRRAISSQRPGFVAGHKVWDL
jgi:hypothetical protein